MRRCLKAAALVALVAWSSVCFAQAKRMPNVYAKDAALLKKSQTYSDDMRKRKPEVDAILRRLGLRYLHELDPTKVYGLNLKTGELTVSAQSEASPSGVGSIGGFGAPSALIRSSGSAIYGQGRTVVFCPLSGQLAEVEGFMASTLARDPVAGIRPGILVVDNFLKSEAEVNFSVVKATGGARNPSNRTVMETTHTGSCGDELKVANLVTTWPPLRIDMVIDDTGSMSNELDGLKAGLASFIEQQGTQDGPQREVSYELISFKDSPTIRLAETTDGAAAIAAVQTLYASGGGDCPEDSMGGVDLALQRIGGQDDSEGAIVLVTDASPHSGDISSSVAMARSLGVKVHVLLTGDCVAGAAAAADMSAAVVSARQVFKQLADQTGGVYLYEPNLTSSDYAAILAELFESARSGYDREAPVVTVEVSPSRLWPANHKLVRVDAKVAAVDNVDPTPIVALENVTSSDATNGRGDGSTDNDIVVDANGVVWLRAERSGSGKDRIYTLRYRATDKSGNVGYGSAEVRVPHDAR